MRWLQNNILCNTLILVIMITNVLHPHLFGVMTWLLTDDILTEPTPKAASAFLAKMHVLAKHQSDFRCRNYMCINKMVS
jgi:hypothetical protein